MSHQLRMRPFLGLLIAIAILFTLAVAPSFAAAPDAENVKFSGVIVAHSPDSWTVAGFTLAIDASTRIRVTTGSIEDGMWADVTARRDPNGTLVARMIVVIPPEMRLKGEVLEIPDGGIGTWIIAGQSFEVTADTQISPRGGPIEVGTWVTVVAVEDPAGTLVALRLRAIDPLPAVEVYGAIQAFDDTSWLLSGVPLAVNAETLIRGEPQVGLLAHAAAELQEDGSLLALRIKVVRNEAGQTHPPVTLTGTIDRLPPNGLNGRWVVEGVNVLVNHNTAINQDTGLAVVGAEVQVDGWQAGENIMAVDITVLSSPATGGQPVQFTGRITALPEGGLIGTWMLDDEQQVQVTDTTRITGERFAQVGAYAHVRGLRLPTDEVIALWVQVHRGRPELSVEQPSTE